jgi:hypothetical protein
MNNYLEMVKVYLNQELPPPYNDLLSVVDDRIRVTLPDDGKAFNAAYAIIHLMIVESVNRIRDIQYNLDFTIWSEGQLRDFTITKIT